MRSKSAYGSLDGLIWGDHVLQQAGELWEIGQLWIYTEKWCCFVIVTLTLFALLKGNCRVTNYIETHEIQK